jgi:prepilin-type N-terminal cleavage/methylation domain-containing protein
MSRGAFTLVEMLVAMLISAIIVILSVMTFNGVSASWTSAAEYMDKFQRSDYALNQVVGALRSMYYPHDGQQDGRYGFILSNNGDGEDADSSDVIEWSKIGRAIVGNKSSVADSVHRVRIMVLEEGNSDWKKEIAETGLYARLCPDAALRGDQEDVDFSFENNEMYQPVLISSGVCGFNCRVVKEPPKTSSSDNENEEKDFEDEFAESNAVPYKVELSFRMIDPDTRAYRSGAAPIVRIVRIPIYEQSLDGKVTPGGEGKESNTKKHSSR